MKLLLILLLTLQSFTSDHIVNDNECSVVFDGIDLKTKLYRKELAPQKLFNFTPAELKNDIQLGNLIETQGQLIKIEDNYYLNLNLSLYSKKAAQQYGSITQGSALNIKTIDGNNYKLICRAGSNGLKVNFQSNYIYPTSYTLDKSLLKKLTKSEIDRIGIEWSSGYEEYTVYELDFFINQIACLTK